MSQSQEIELPPKPLVVVTDKSELIHEISLTTGSKPAEKADPLPSILEIARNKVSDVVTEAAANPKFKFDNFMGFALCLRDEAVPKAGVDGKGRTELYSKREKRLILDSVVKAREVVRDGGTISDILILAEKDEWPVVAGMKDRLLMLLGRDIERAAKKRRKAERGKNPA